MAEEGEARAASRWTLGCSRPSLVAAVVLISLLASTVVSGERNAGSLRLKICVAVPMQIKVSPDKLIPIPVVVKAGAAIALAAKHISDRNFTLVPDGAPLLGDRAVSLELVFVNLASFTDAYLMPLAVKTCSELGAHYILGIPNAAYARAGSLMTQYYGIPLSSVTVISPRLSDEETFPMFHRLVHSTVDRVLPTTRFLHHMGWREVAIVYTADIGGEGMRNVLQAAMLEEGISYTTFAFPVAHDVQSYTSQVHALVNSGIQVVIEVSRIDGFATLCAAIDAVGVEARNLTWIRPATAVEVLRYLDYPRSKSAAELLERTTHGWLSFAAPALNHAPLQEAYAELDMESTLGNLVDAVGEPVDTHPAIYNLARAPLESEVVLRAYDSVWVAVGALVQAAENLAGSGQGEVGHKALGLQAHKQITSGMVSLSGLSGKKRFKPSGDLDVDPEKEELMLVNLVYTTNVDDKAPLKERCAGFYRNGEWLLQTDANGTCSPVVWPGGGVYPYVPNAGMSFQSVNHADVMAVSLSIVIVALAIVLVMATTLLMRHNKGLRERVKTMQQDAAFPGLDMDTPVARMVRFLRQYQQSVTHLFTRPPNLSEAAALEVLIINHADKLSAPDWQGQLASKPNDAVTDGVYDYVLKEFANREPGSARRGCSMRRTSTSSIESSSLNSMGPHTSWGPLCSPEMKSVLKSADFFLDAITHKSLLRKCPNPLAAVVGSAVESLCLLPGSLSSTEALLMYMREIEAGYMEDGYHCCYHAADVTNRLVSLLHATGIATASNSSNHRITMLAAIFGAAVHDYKHPQVNNGFLIEEESDLAMMFNDYAVLEMYSLQSAFQLLASSPSVDFMYNWKKANRTVFRKTALAIVLATDMSSHFDLVGQFSTQIGQNRALEGKTGTQKWQAMGPRDRLLTLQVAIKVADLGHCYTKLSQHRAWVKRLEEEFFKQGDQERAAGRNPGPLMDRGLPGVSAPSSSIGFFRVIGLPLISAWVDVFPECRFILDQAKHNFSWWQEQERTGVGKSRARHSSVCDASTSSTTTSRSASLECEIPQTESPSNNEISNCTLDQSEGIIANAV